MGQIGQDRHGNPQPYVSTTKAKLTHKLGHLHEIGGPVKKEHLVIIMG